VVALAVEVLVIVAWRLTILAWRDLCLHTLVPSSSDESIAVVAFVGNQVFGINALDQACSLSAIRSGIFRSNDSDRHTVRIHGHMVLRVAHPFFLRLIPWFPRRAPAACG
jgi:hypothetical protein